MNTREAYEACLADNALETRNRVIAENAIRDFIAHLEQVLGPLCYLDTRTYDRFNLEEEELEDELSKFIWHQDDGYWEEIESWRDPLAPEKT